MKFQWRGIRNFSKLASERGVALIVVLWIFIFLFVVAFGFSASVREEAAAAGRYGDETQGYYLAIAGFEQGLYDFLSQSSGRELQQGQKSSDLFDGSWREQNLGGGVYRVRLIDEGGKININRVDEAILRRIFTNLGIEEPRRSILVDSIMDWRDPDDLHRVNGAENDYYLSLNPPYTAKNGFFDTVEDLLWVRGMTSDLFYGYAEANQAAGSEKTLADLLPLLGISAGDSAMQMFIFANPAVVAVEAEGRPTDSRVSHRIKGIVRMGGGQQGFELLRWIDRDGGYRNNES